MHLQVVVTRPMTASDWRPGGPLNGGSPAVRTPKDQRSSLGGSHGGWWLDLAECVRAVLCVRVLVCSTKLLEECVVEMRGCQEVNSFPISYLTTLSIFASLSLLLASF